MPLIDLISSALALDAAGNPEPQFDRIAALAGPDLLGRGIAAALRAMPADAWPPTFEQLYVHSDATQQAGLLNHLIAAAPATASAAADGALALLLAPGGSAASALQADAQAPSVLVDPVRPASGSDRLSTLQATALRPRQVAQIAAAVVAEAPAVLEALGRYYAQYPVLVKTLGQPALLAILRELRRQLSPPPAE